MILELTILGLLTGLISGFFGIGGGMFLVPLLLLLSFDMKEAIAISIMQMVFSSIYGTFLNLRKNLVNIKDGITVGIGGFLGGLQSSFILKTFSSSFLQYVFICTLLFSIYKVAFAKVNGDPTLKGKTNPFILLFSGFAIGTIAMGIGVGGSVMLTPILVGFLFYNIKEATSLGLFFIIFSSVAGFISLSLSGQMLYFEGFIVGIGSLVGVHLGIILKSKTKIQSYKKFTLLLYASVLSFMIYKTLF